MATRAFKFPMRAYKADGERYFARIRHVKTPEDFHITLTDNEDAYNELFDELQRVYKECLKEKRISPLVGQVEIDDHCIYLHDPFFLRGRVIAIKDDNKVDMVDVDTGEVSRNVSVRSLFPVINNCLFRQTPVLAPRCKLPNICPTSAAEWDEETIQYFITNYTERQLTVEFLGQEEELYVVKLYMTSRPVCDHMIHMGLARRQKRTVVGSRLPPLDLHAKIGDNVDVIICYVNSPSSFYVQLSRNEDLLSKLSREVLREYMINGDQYTRINLSKGQNCVAKYDKDNGWYRAEIIDRISPNLVEVQFIDYGNKSRVLVKDLRQLKEEFARVAPQGVHCRLLGVRSLPVLADRFAKVAEGQRMTAQIHKVDYEHCLLTVTLVQTVGSVRYDINEYLDGRAQGPPLPRSPIMGVAPCPYPDNEFDLGSDDEDQAPGPSYGHARSANYGQARGRRYSRGD